MTAVNMLTATSALGITANVNLANTSENSLISNGASSSLLLKINSIIVSNTDGTTAYPITITYHSAASLGGTAYPIASTISVPANTSLIVVNKDCQIYLGENSSLGATAGTANKLTVTCSYEQLS